MPTGTKEFEITNIELSATAGAASLSSKGRDKVNKSATKGNKSATHIQWTPPDGYNTLTVTIQTRLSPGGSRKGPDEYKPTSCGPLTLNEGATAFEDADFDGAPDRDGEGNPIVIVGPSNALVVEVVAGTQPCES